LVNEEPAKGAGDVALPPIPESQGYIPKALANGEIVEIAAVSQYRAIEYARAAVLADRQQRGGEAPDRDAVDLARCGMELHSPGMPEYIVCAELVRIADARAALPATKGESNG